MRIRGGIASCRLSDVNSTRASQKKPERQFNVGDKIKVNMHAGKIVDATVRAVIQATSGVKLQIDFGFEQTALIDTWQVVENS